MRILGKRVSSLLAYVISFIRSVFCDFSVMCFVMLRFLFFFFFVVYFQKVIVSYEIKEGLSKILLFSECFLLYIFIFRTKMPVMTLLITMITLNQRIR